MTNLAMVSDPPWDIGVLQGMVGDCPRDSGLTSRGRWVTIFGMVYYNSRYGG